MAGHHRKIEKTDSSVSLVRKKFEKKTENSGDSSGSRTAAGSESSVRRQAAGGVSDPLAKGRISQNVFLKTDAEKRRPRSEAARSPPSSSSTNSTSNSSPTSTPNHNSQPLINKDNASESGVMQPNSSTPSTSPPSTTTTSSSSHPHSNNDSLQMKAKSGPSGAPLFSSCADLVPSPRQLPDQTDPDLNCQIESINGNPANPDTTTTTTQSQEDSTDQQQPDFLHGADVVTEKLFSQTGSDLEDEEEEEADVGGRIDVTLEQTVAPGDMPDLPESPGCRSPQVSDSDNDEPAIQTSRSRQHVLDALANTSDSQPTDSIASNTTTTTVPLDEPPVVLRNKLLSNLVNKRSESDGIVTMDRPKSEKPVRRCESMDLDELELVSEAGLGSPFPAQHNIKTVTPATIMKGPEDDTAGLGETVYLRAHYFGNPEPRVVWFRNGRRLNHTERTMIRTYPGESTLVVRELRADDSGKYDIQIENEMGADACSASLCVEGPPEPPGARPFITSIDKEMKRLTLAWYGSTFDGGSMLTGYIVEMSSWVVNADPGMPEPTDWTILTSKCHSTSYIVKNLDEEREYIFRVKAQNIHGPSVPGKVSEPVSFLRADEDDLDDDEEEEADSEDEEFDSPFEHRVVSLEAGDIFKHKFDIYEELGRGRFGVVFKVRDKDTRETFAAKFVRCRKQEEREKCKEEISIMNGLDHGRLLQLAAAYENPREVIMIMEFIGGGELFEKVVADDFTLTEHDCVLFMRQICAAIGYMHQKNIVHLDLKPENILCKSKKSHQIKIIDFGLTRKLKPGEDVRILFGTPEFVSPEVISYEPVSASSDMWSVGVVCYVLLSGLSPFMGDSDVETFANITGMCYDFDDEAFEHISEDAKDFILKLLVKDQRKRLKALECLKHPWLSQRHARAKGDYKEINTDKLKSFLMRRRWQKAAHAIRALGRFTALGFRQDSKGSESSIALSTQSADF